MSSRESPLNRRQFLGSSARNAAHAAVGVVGLSQMQRLQAQPKLNPHDAVRVGIVGLRNQGASLFKAFQANPGCVVSAICDIDESVCQKVLQGGSSATSGNSTTQPTVYDQYQRLLDDRSVSAVVIATPDHHHAWMTALACAAGKDVYLEVPTTHTLEQGDELREMIRNSGSVVQTGMAHRSGAHYLSAMEFLHSGELGAVRFARAWTCVQRQALRPLMIDLSQQPRTSFAQNWLGGQETQLHPADWHFHWRWMWNFGSGELGSWGVNLLDIARWGLKVVSPERVSAIGGNYHFRDGREAPDTLSVQYEFAGASIVWEHRQATNRGLEGRSQGVAFYGDRGVLIVDRSGWKVYDHASPVSHQASDAQSAHVQNFLDSVRHRVQPAASFEAGCLSTKLCHLGNLAYKQGCEWRSSPVIT